MKKSISKLGTVLNKTRQKQINGGYDTEASCLEAGGFWGLSFYTEEWCCTVADGMGNIRSYC